MLPSSWHAPGMVLCCTAATGPGMWSTSSTERACAARWLVCSTLIIIIQRRRRAVCASTACRRRAREVKLCPETHVAERAAAAALLLAAEQKLSRERGWCWCRCHEGGRAGQQERQDPNHRAPPRLPHVCDLHTSPSVQDCSLCTAASRAKRRGAVQASPWSPCARLVSVR